jgi:Uncharacterized protein conserved in bacteria (DUF2059)
VRNLCWEFFMTRFVRPLFACLMGLTLGLSSPFLHAQSPTSQAMASVQAADDWDRLLEMSSLEKTLRELPGFFKLGLEQARAQGAPVTPQMATALNAAAQEVLRLEPLHAAVKADLAATLTPEELAQWMQFYASALGQKLREADVRAASPAFQQALMPRAPQVMEALSRDSARMALLQSWLQTTQAVEQATEMALQTQLAMEWGLVSTLPPAAGKPGFQDLRNHLESQRMVVRAQMAQYLLVHAAAAYQAMSNEELGQLLAQANRPEARKFYLDFSRKLYARLAALTERLGQTAGRKLAEQPA